MTAKFTTLVIETVNSEGTEWGISFNGPNPLPTEYFKMASQHDAFRLDALLNGGTPEQFEPYHPEAGPIDLHDRRLSY